MSEQNIKEVTYIYLVSNIGNDKYSVYVGKTKNFSREKDHRRTFGDRIEFTIIEEIPSFERKYWQPLESFWIEQFTQWGFNVFNVKKRGGSGVEYHSQVTKDKIRAKHLRSSKRGLNHHNYGKKNLKLSALNKLKIGNKHPMYSKKNLGASLNSSKRFGDKNPNFNKSWITDGQNTKLLGIQQGIPEGWRRGRTFKKTL